jgi:hypothetical protein
MIRLLLAVSALAVVPLSSTLAQTAPTSSPQDQQPAAPAPGQPHVAQPCLDDLAALGERMTDEGYWLTGWRQGGALGAPAPSPAASALPEPDAPVPATPANGGEPDPTTAAPSPGLHPWGAVTWQQAPGHELRTLYAAAEVLARRGDQQGCQAVLAKLSEIYDQYAGELRQAGVEPGEVTSWRAQRLALA